MFLLPIVTHPIENLLELSLRRHWITLPNIVQCFKFLTKYFTLYSQHRTPYFPVDSILLHIRNFLFFSHSIPDHVPVYMIFLSGEGRGVHVPPPQTILLSKTDSITSNTDIMSPAPFIYKFFLLFFPFPRCAPPLFSLSHISPPPLRLWTWIE
jgi:hypothetical protein